MSQEISDGPFSRYVVEELDGDWEDDGTMVDSLAALTNAVVGRRIVAAGRERLDDPDDWHHGHALVLTLDDGTRAVLRESSDCCAYTYVDSFLLDPSAVDHVILGVGTTERFTKWHIYADFGDIMQMEVGWSCGNPFYYGYGFDIEVLPA